MHFHTDWLEPSAVKPSTKFAPVATPEEMRRRNIAALDRNDVVKAIASGDQLQQYASELGRRLTFVRRALFRSLVQNGVPFTSKFQADLRQTADWNSKSRNACSVPTVGDFQLQLVSSKRPF
jgi:hypothetical protein